MHAINLLIVAFAATVVNVVLAAITVTVTDIIDVTTTIWDDGSASGKAIAKSSWSCCHTPSSSQTFLIPSPPPCPTTQTSTTVFSTSPTTTITPPTDPPNGDIYAQRVLDHHNIHRQNNSVGSLNWDGTLAEIALEIASSCYYAHNTGAGGGGYGQNIAAGAPPDNITSIITDAFYNGEIVNFASLYGQATPDNINTDAFDSWGHYTQVVWAATTNVGCATVNCTSKGLVNVDSDVPPYFTVCNYYPAGMATLGLWRANR